jgi:multicomponent Na+:H+ antiporter subunit E
LARAISLFVALAAVWLLLSGHYTGFLLTLGAISCVLVVLVAWRLSVVDRESVPLDLAWRLPGYWLWLIWQIVIANIDVARRILDPKLPIDPRLFEIDCTQKSDLGRVIYANSITLTPGTISTDVRGNMIQVHALSADGERDLREGEMDRKVTALEKTGAGA